MSARRSKKAAALPKPRKLRRTWPQRLLIGFNVFLVGVCLVTAGGIFYTFNRFGDLPRIELAHVLSPEPQSEAPDKAQNFLLVGSDSRASIDPDDPNIGAFGSESDVGGQRSDTIMVLRIDPASERASILSFPRDLWVDIAGTGSKQRINTAFSRGPDVLVATLQQNFGIPIQHFIEVDFAGSRASSARWAACPCTSRTRRDKNTGLNIPVAGCANLNGDQALAYAVAALRIQGRQQVAHRRHRRSRAHQPPAGLHPAVDEEGDREGHPQPDRAQPADRRRHPERHGRQQPVGP